MSETANNIGIPNVSIPEKVCDDRNCPFHGDLPLRGRIFSGKVVSKKQKKSVVIKKEYDFYVKKYQRYERRNKTFSAHLPECLTDTIEVGDMVRAAECRKLSKTISSVVIDKALIGGN